MKGDFFGSQDFQVQNGDFNFEIRKYSEMKEAIKKREWFGVLSTCGTRDTPPFT
jgi:hypothetical protein